MRWQALSWLFLAFIGLAQAVSSVGTRLLVLIDEDDNQSRYSQFLSDLNGTHHKPNYESKR